MRYKAKLKVFYVTLVTEKHDIINKNIAAYTPNEAILITCNKSGITVNRLIGAAATINGEVEK